MDNEGVEITSTAGLQSDSKCVARPLKPPKEKKSQDSKILIYLFPYQCNVSFFHVSAQVLGLMTRMVWKA